MLSADRIRELFHALEAELRTRGVVGEVGLCRGAVMCLVFEARQATKDVDAVFQPAAAIREAAREVAARLGVAEDWLNDAAKGFFHADPPRQPVLDLPNLRVWAPTADYMLAMKCVAARFDSHDLDDVKFLINHLGLASPEDVFAVIEMYYPRRNVPAKAQCLVEELMAGR